MGKRRIRRLQGRQRKVKVGILSKWNDFMITPCSSPGNWRGKRWRLCNELIWRYGCMVFVIPAGFETDGASIPRFYRWRFDPFGKWIRAAVIHDWLYSNVAAYTHIDRKASDVAFRDLMKRECVCCWTRTVIYYAVRIGGWLAFRKD